MTTHDYSTIDHDALAKLPVSKLAPTYRLQDEPGNGCYMDPPGFPSYFTRSVYTRYGNNPGRGATTVLLGHVVEVAEWSRGDTWDARHAAYEARLLNVWRKLPLDHGRTRAWIIVLHQYLRHCYVDDDAVAEPHEYGKPATIIYPVPDYKLRVFNDDPRLSDEARTAERTAVDAYNASKRANYDTVATLDNHAAVRRIRRFYPEYSPTPSAVQRMEDAPRPGDWWERHAARPTVDACQPPRWLGAHRASGRCQFCGAVDNVQAPPHIEPIADLVRPT